MLLSYVELLELVEQGVINAPLENINASSIDLTLGGEIMVASRAGTANRAVDLVAKESIKLQRLVIPEAGY